MSAQDNGGPAFPREDYQTDHAPGQRGMTLRDYFAAKAMAGLLANPGGPIQDNTQCGWDFVNCTDEDVAGLCYRIADAMLKASQA